MKRGFDQLTAWVMAVFLAGAVYGAAYIATRVAHHGESGEEVVPVGHEGGGEEHGAASEEHGGHAEGDDGDVERPGKPGDEHHVEHGESAAHEEKAQGDGHDAKAHEEKAH